MLIFPGLHVHIHINIFWNISIPKKYANLKDIAICPGFTWQKRLDKRHSTFFLKSTKVHNHLKQIQEENVYPMNKSYTNWWF